MIPLLNEITPFIYFVWKCFWTSDNNNSKSFSLTLYWISIRKYTSVATPPLVVDRYHIMFNGWQEWWSEKGNVEPFCSVMEVCLNKPFHFLLKRKGGERNAFFWHRTLFPMWHLTIWHNFVKVDIVKKMSVLDCVMGLESSDWQGNKSSKVRGNCHFLVGSTNSKHLSHSNYVQSYAPWNLYVVSNMFILADLTLIITPREILQHGACVIRSRQSLLGSCSNHVVGNLTLIHLCSRSKLSTYLLFRA